MKMKDRKPVDRRLTRTEVDFERRVNPYVYECEVKELSELLHMPIKVMQQMINDKVQDYRMMMSAGDGSEG